MTITVPVSVVIPTYKRCKDLEITLNKILSCSPIPSEIIVHIDGGDNETELLIEEKFSFIKWIKSNSSIGPGGGRNKGIRAANNEYIASFDDDSYPIHTDYFERLIKVFQLLPEAVVIESSIFHINEEQPKDIYNFKRCFLFTGCGVAYRKEAFLKIGDYVPVSPAYGMEEVDFCLRSVQYDALFIRTTWLTVFHNTRLSHHVSPSINAASITNIALLAFLRYPIVLWPYGMLQVINRILWTIKNGRFKGLGKGIFQIPTKCLQYRRYRKTVALHTIKGFIRNRTNVFNYNLPSKN